MVLILAMALSCNPENDPITPSLFFFWVCDYGFFSFISIWQFLDGPWSTVQNDVYGYGQNHGSSQNRRGLGYEEAQAPRWDYRRQAQGHRLVQATLDLSGIPH